MFDLLIKNGRVVDGTGAPARGADVGVKDGRIVEVGSLREPAARTIDADGQVVAPGFVDVHTHYDAQVFWDPTLSPSSYHGVTTVFGGNCGFSIAPLNKEAAPYLLRMLSRVEGMPETSLREGVPWDWESFGDYLGRIEGKVGLNAGFMCGHSAIRRVVMGERAVGSQATSEDLARMRALLATSLREGAMGFSSTVSVSHNDADGEPVPSRHATREELIELARVCRDFPGTSLEIIPGVNAFGETEMSLMADMAAAADRTINWNTLSIQPGNEAVIESQLAATEYARQRGARVKALTTVYPGSMRLNFHSGFVFDMLDGWAPVFRLPVPERIALLQDAAKRRELDQRGRSEASGSMRRVAEWERFVVVESRAKDLEGQKIGDIAQRQGKSPIDVMLDIAVADELRTVFSLASAGRDDQSWNRRAALWRDERTVIGASDAGAHLDLLDAFAFSTHLLSAARERNLLSLEEAVQQLTDVPARLLGLKQRGLIKTGWHADLVVFDPDTVGSGEAYVRHDLPGGEMRLYADAQGVGHVVVNGAPIVEEGAHTGALPGKVLRSGRDTETSTLH
jgi:N-acyl-D-aspartate/D-glutamate deacylase